MKPDLSSREKADLMSKSPTHTGMFRAIGVKPIGYWLSKPQGNNPEHLKLAHSEGFFWPGDFVDETWDPAERATVIAYLKQTLPEFKMSYCGYSWCRLCPEGPPIPPGGGPIPAGSEYRHMNGSSDYGDGTFEWPQGYAHYVEAHGVKPPQEFVEHVLAQKGKFPEPKPMKPMRRRKRK